MISEGGKGLIKARGRRNEKEMKKLAKSEKAYTVKVKATFGKGSPEEVCRYINEQAGLGRPCKNYNKEGFVIGDMVRASVTDTNEVWARVIPCDGKNIDFHYDIEGLE